jgi:hypothetical protein
MGKRGDKRRKQKRERNRLRRIPYEGMQFGPLTIERYGRRIYTSMDTSSPQFDAFQESMRDAVAELPGEYTNKVETLSSGLAHCDAFDALAAIWMTNSVADPETYKEWEHSGLHAACELLAAVLIRRGAREGAQPRSSLTAALVLESQQLLLEILQIKGFLLMEDSMSGDENAALAEIRASGRSHRLAVRGPSYDWQEEQTVIELFDHERLRDDVVAACGFTIDSAFKLVDGVVDIGVDRLGDRAGEARGVAEQLIADLRRSRDGKPLEHPRSAEMIAALGPLAIAGAEEEIHSRLLAWTSFAFGTTMSFTASELANHTLCTQEEADAFLTTFSLDFGAQAEDGREVDIDAVRDRPIVHDGHGHYLCVSLPSLHWALRPRVERALKEHDEKGFRRYERHRSKTVERRAVAALTRALHPDWAHHGLSYETQEDGVTKRPELDGLIRGDSALLIIESKASSMRPAARRLAPDSLRSWLKSEVSKAALQARRARTALLDEPKSPKLLDSDGQPVAVDLDGVEHVFELVVVLEDLPAIAASTWLLADAELLPREPTPWLVGLHELEIICELVERPSELVHYLLRRRRMDKTRRAWAGDELDYFMHYLLFGLYWDDPDGPPPAPERLLSHTEQMDSWFLFERGQRKTPARRPSPGHHADVASLLDCLEESGGIGRLDAALAILDLDSKPRRDVASALKALRRRSLLDGREHDQSLVGSELGITVMSCPPHEASALGEKLYRYCTLKKHQMKLDRWVGFGGWSGPREPFQVAVAIHGPWEPDGALDALVATLPSAGFEKQNFDGRAEARRRRPRR